MARNALLEEISNLIENHFMTYSEVSQFITEKYAIRGYSTSTIRKLCKEYGIRRGGREPLSSHEVSEAVKTAIEETGPSYGRKMMTGYLASKGISVGERRVGKALRTLNEPYHIERQRGVRNLNPKVYTAEYFGHKLHMDQNEKLCMFGTTHVAAVDGYSGKIVAWSTMPVKNNLRIYEDVYRSAVLEYGIWDQIRVDHGSEFYLSLYIQEKNSMLRRNTDRSPYLQTPSKRNHRVERIWSEINQRVNYPIKDGLISLVESDIIDLEDNITKFCVSSLTCEVAKIGVQRCVESWNAHRIPGKGTPNDLAIQSNCVAVDVQNFPSGIDAAENYSSELGTRLTLVSEFGSNPFHSEHDQQVCERYLSTQCPDLQLLLNTTVNRDYSLFQSTLVRLIEKTEELCI